MDVPRCRRFNLGDAMILVAAAALMLASLPEAPDPIRTFRDIPTGSLQPYLSLVVVSARFLFIPWLCLTAGYVVCRLARPRPPWRRLREQPGFVAVAAALALAAWNVVWLILYNRRRGSLGADLWEIIPSIPPAVIGSWIALWLVGRWAPEPGWIDRLGRGIGWGWIALYLVHGACSALTS